MDLAKKGIFAHGGLPISLLVLTFSVMYAGFGPVSASEAAGADNIGASIVLVPSSEARFFDCGVTPTNGSSTLLGFSADESAPFALTDGDLDTVVMGSAVFDVLFSSNSSIVNNPGAELTVVEMAGAEPINVSITDPETGEVKSISLMPAPGNSTNNCDMAMNQVFVDLSSLGVLEGSSVSSVRFNNLGDVDSLLGSDIAEICIAEPETSNACQPIESSQGFLPFLPLFR